MFMTEDAMYMGTGVGMPLGIRASGALVSVAKETGQLADTVVAENVINMWARRYVRGSYIWMINQNVMPQLQHMTIDSGNSRVSFQHAEKFRPEEKLGLLIDHYKRESDLTMIVFASTRSEVDLLKMNLKKEL